MRKLWVAFGGALGGGAANAYLSLWPEAAGFFAVAVLVGWGMRAVVLEKREVYGRFIRWLKDQSDAEEEP